MYRMDLSIQPLLFIGTMPNTADSSGHNKYLKRADPAEAFLFHSGFRSIQCEFFCGLRTEIKRRSTFQIPLLL